MDQLDDEGDVKGNEETGKAKPPIGLSMLLPSFIRLPTPPPNEVPSELNNASTVKGMLYPLRMRK